MRDSVARLNKEIVDCRRCPRLVEHRERVAREKRRAYRDWEYWGKAVPGFGDAEARLLIVGLAPGAHGSNRTGRMFTGDSSGDLLYRTLYETGFASQALAESREDGMQLHDAFITARARCAPPDNKPRPEEYRNCQPFLERELKLLKNVRVVVALGRIAMDGYLGILQAEGKIGSRSEYRFAHGAVYPMEPPLPALVVSYHPSRQNTQTGRLTEEMFLQVFREAQNIVK